VGIQFGRSARSPYLARRARPSDLIPTPNLGIHSPAREGLEGLGTVRKRSASPAWGSNSDVLEATRAPPPAGDRPIRLRTRNSGTRCDNPPAPASRPARSRLSTRTLACPAFPTGSRPLAARRLREPSSARCGCLVRGTNLGDPLRLGSRRLARQLHRHPPT